jgi:hypothetical protein
MSADTEHRNFLGIAVEGKIQHNKPNVEQKPLTELEPLLRALLADDGLASFGWRQYTPYFNDGDACIFRIRAPWFRTPDTDEDLDAYELEVSRYREHPTIGGQNWDTKAFVGADQGRWERCLAFAEAIESSEFDHVLIDAFGDHASITVTRDGITVDVYEHD